MHGRFFPVTESALFIEINVQACMHACAIIRVRGHLHLYNDLSIISDNCMSNDIK